VGVVDVVIVLMDLVSIVVYVSGVVMWIFSFDYFMLDYLLIV